MSLNYASLDYSDLEWIARACGKAGRLNENKWICLCPAHDDRTPSLSISLGRKGQILLYCHAGCSYEQIVNRMSYDIQRLIQTKQGERRYTHPVYNTYKQNKTKSFLDNRDSTIKDNLDKSDNNSRITGYLSLKNVIKDAKSIIDSPVEAYLNKRLNGGLPHIQGILTPNLVGYLPYHWHAESGKSWPVMVAPIMRGDELIGLHRTYLDENGNKAPISPVKKILGKLSSGHTPFGDNQNILILAEGIETALSLYVMFQTPVWAALASTNMANITLPPLPLARTVYIAQDNDEAGRKAAQKAADKFWREGRKVTFMNPPNHLNDFNDYLHTGASFEQYRYRFH